MHCTNTKRIEKRSLVCDRIFLKTILKLCVISMHAPSVADSLIFFKKRGESEVDFSIKIVVLSHFYIHQLRYRNCGCTFLTEKSSNFCYIKHIFPLTYLSFPHDFEYKASLPMQYGMLLHVNVSLWRIPVEVPKLAE